MFGEIGTARLSLFQRVALYTRAAVLLPPRAAALLCGTLLMRLACLLSTRLPALRPHLLAPAARNIGRALLFVCGIVRCRHTDWRHLGRGADGGAPPAMRSRDDTAVVVCNHVSWLDILMVQARPRSCRRSAGTPPCPPSCPPHATLCSTPEFAKDAPKRTPGVITHFVQPAQGTDLIAKQIYGAKRVYWMRLARRLCTQGSVSIVLSSCAGDQWRM